MEEIVEETFDMDKLMQEIKAQVLAPKAGELILVNIPDEKFAQQPDFQPFVDHLSALFPANVVFVLPNDVSLSSIGTGDIKKLREACDRLLSQPEIAHADS